MKKVFILIVCLGLLTSTATAFAQSTLKEDFTDELCQCLIYHAYEQYHLGAITKKKDLVTHVMNTCYGVHFLQVRTHVPNTDVALDMMGEKEVERAYEDLAKSAVKFVIEMDKK